MDVNKLLRSKLLPQFSQTFGIRRFVQQIAPSSCSGTNVQTKQGEYSTSQKGIFTAGDMHRGQSLVVWAIREGREAAREVDKDLMGYTNLN